MDLGTIRIHVWWLISSKPDRIMSMSSSPTEIQRLHYKFGNQVKAKPNI